MFIILIVTYYWLAFSGHAGEHVPQKEFSDGKEALFDIGKGLFDSAWVSSPSTTKLRDGLGPLSKNACSSCHHAGG